MFDSVRTFFAGMWFCLVLIPTMVLGALFYLGILMFILSMLATGYSLPSFGLTYFKIVSIPFLLTNIFFRRCYTMIDKLYPFSIFALCNFFIVALAEKILAYGFDVIEPTRHLLTIIAVIVQVLVCRIIMGFYFRKHPFN